MNLDRLDFHHEKENNMSKDNFWTDEQVEYCLLSILNNYHYNGSFGEKISKFKERHQIGGTYDGKKTNFLTHDEVGQWQEPKPALFTTEDGVEIKQGYDGDLWRVFITNHSYDMWKPYNLGMPQYIDSKSEKYFSTESAAQEYITLNKPCLSVNDVLGLCDDMQFHTRQDRMDEDYYAVYVSLLDARIKELAKQKTKEQ